MATNKKAVMVYLPEDLESFVSGYCLANGITIEKGGEVSPRMGTGIVRLLESLSKSESTTTGKSLSPSQDKVKDLETAIATLRSEIESVKMESPPMPNYELSRSEIQEMINESIALALANAAKPVAVASTPIEAAIANLPEPVESEPVIVEPKVTITPHQIEQGREIERLIGEGKKQSEIAKSWGVTPSLISTVKGKYEAYLKQINATEPRENCPVSLV